MTIPEFTILIVDSLSSYTIVGSCCGNPSSSIIERKYNMILAAETAA